MLYLIAKNIKYHQIFYIYSFNENKIINALYTNYFFDTVIDSEDVQITFDRTSFSWNELLIHFK